MMEDFVKPKAQNRVSYLLQRRNVGNCTLTLTGFVIKIVFSRDYNGVDVDLKAEISHDNDLSDAHGTEEFDIPHLYGDR